MLLVTFVVLTLSACGGGSGESAEHQQSKERILPNLSGSLPPGTYASKEFKPLLSLNLEKGWALYNPELPDRFDIARAGGTTGAGQGGTLSLGISFFNVRKIFDYLSQAPARPPDDMAARLQKHPGLDAVKPVSTKVSGVPGARIDTQRPSEDVVRFQLSNGGQWDPSTRHQPVAALGELYESLLPTRDRPSKL